MCLSRIAARNVALASAGRIPNNFHVQFKRFRQNIDYINKTNVVFSVFVTSFTGQNKITRKY